MIKQTIPLFSQVKLTTKTKTYEGTLLPDEGDSKVLKLSSGYALSFKKENILNLTLISKPKKAKTQPKQSISFNKESIVIMHTGGTISSKVDYKTGAVIASFDPNTLIELFPKLKEISNIESQFIGNIMSDNFRFHHFNQIAQAIHKRALKGQTKFIVTSGTDFLHYLSASLAFLLKDLPISTIVVGSQRSSDRPSTDAENNLTNAAYFLENKFIPGVFVCMHSTSSDGTCDILHGVNVRKMHSSRRDAFKQINEDKVAEVNYISKSITMLKEYSFFIQKEIPKTLPLFKENLKIGLVYSHPQFYAKELDAYKKFDGLILAGSGFGHFPVIASDKESKEHNKILKSIQTLAKTMPIIMSTQTINGAVNLTVYSPLRMIEDAGVVGHNSTMITETAFIKLAYLLSTAKKEDIKQLILTNIVGELNPEKYFSFEENE